MGLFAQVPRRDRSQRRRNLASSPRVVSSRDSVHDECIIRIRPTRVLTTYRIQHVCISMTFSIRKHSYSGGSRIPPTANERLTHNVIDEHLVSRIAGLGKYLHETECCMHSNIPFTK